MKGFILHESDLHEISKIQKNLSELNDIQIENKINDLIQNFPQVDALQIKFFINCLLYQRQLLKDPTIKPDVQKLCSYQNIIIPHPEQLNSEELTKAWNMFRTKEFSNCIKVAFEDIDSITPIIQLITCDPNGRDFFKIRDNLSHSDREIVSNYKPVYLDFLDESPTLPKSPLM